jgi:hypothetical protein
VKYRRRDIERQLDELEYFVEDAQYYAIENEDAERVDEIQLAPIVWAARQFLEKVPPTAKEAEEEFKAVTSFLHSMPIGLDEIEVDLGPIRYALREYAQTRGEVEE